MTEQPVQRSEAIAAVRGAVREALGDTLYQGVALHLPSEVARYPIQKVTFDLLQMCKADKSAERVYCPSFLVRVDNEVAEIRYGLLPMQDS